MKKIVLFFYDSGPSDNITNIIKNFKSQINWYFFAYKDSPAYRVLKNKSLEGIFIDIEQIKDIKKQIQNINPDSILVGTSWQNKDHLNFIHYAKELHIPSVAMLEHWVNYRERFTYPNKNWEENKPDFITVNDNYAYSIAKKYGFENIIKLKFYTLLNYIKKLEKQNIKEQNELLFISEPTRKVALNNFNDENYWGFNEYNLIENIAKNIQYFQTNKLKIRLHPSDEKGKYDYLHKKFTNLKIKIEDPYKVPLLTSIISSKIIIGIDGFVLYAAKVLGKYSISFIPNDKRKCVVPLFKQNFISTINKETSLKNFKKRKSFKGTKKFGISFNKFLKNITIHKSLKASIIGCGNIGGLYDSSTSNNIFTHAHAYTKNTNTVLQSCCDLNKENIEQFKNLWGENIKSYECIEQLLMQERPDIVSLTTSTNSHYPLLKKLLLDNNIKYIICEKPLVSTLSEFYSVERLMNESDSKIIINFIRCFDPSTNKIKKLISSKKLGKVLSFNAYFNKGIYHNGSHCLSLIEHLIGNIKSIKVLNKEIYEEDIYGNFILNLEDNISGTINNFYQTNFSTLELTIILKHGIIRILNSGFDIIVYKSKKSKFKGINQLSLYKKYPNTLKYYAKHSLDFLLQGDTKTQMKRHLNISKKLLILKERFLLQTNYKVKF